MNTPKAGWLVIIAAILAAVMAASVLCVPSGPSITYAGQSTSSSSSVPTIEGNASIKGGDIATVSLKATQQDTNWKAYVGNVSGSLVLEDSGNYSIYEWPMAAPTGEVYATRTSATINWTSITCANVANVADEEGEMSHTPTYASTDSINETFNDGSYDHWGFVAGSTSISNNSCAYSINPWVNDTAQIATDIFEEVLLFDGSNILYTARIQDNLIGYRNNVNYDFQMLVAENASPGATRTDYYFYVELV